MSSAVNSRNLVAADIDMLRRVLDTAGVFNLDTKWHLERRLRFARLLLRAFQEGVTVESLLASLLISKIEMLHPSCIPGRAKEKLRASRLEKRDGQPHSPTKYADRPRTIARGSGRATSIPGPHQVGSGKAKGALTER